MIKSKSYIYTGLIVLAVVAGSYVIPINKDGDTILGHPKLAGEQYVVAKGLFHATSVNGKPAPPRSALPAEHPPLAAASEKKITEETMVALKDWEKKVAQEVRSLRSNTSEVSSMFMMIPPVTEEFKKEVMNKLSGEGITGPSARKLLEVILKQAYASANYRWIEFAVNFNDPAADSTAVFTSPNNDAIKIDPITDQISIQSGDVVILDNKKAKERYGHLYQVGEVERGGGN